MINTASDSLSPKISIVMAAYNEERGICAALESIIAQTFIDWELIVIDDGSTDSTVAIIQRYAQNDSRIRLVCNEKNLKLSLSLNKGIGIAQADLIARADADDINLPERLAKQYAYMQAHEDIDVLGTGAYLLDQTGQKVSTYSHPITHEELKKLSFLNIHFFHPSVMIRSRFFEVAGLYDSSYTYAQDKEIWLRGLSAGCRYANLAEPLIEYNTGGFVKSWRYTIQHLLSLLRMSRNLKIKGGYVSSLVIIAYTVAMKLKLYRPGSLRPD
jgi:glycosyltransferase involved in cell wall biosynthesis